MIDSPTDSPTDSPNATAIVTGAGSGIGRDAAVLLAEAGYAVALVARREAGLRETLAAIQGEVGGDAPVLVLPADVGDPAAVAGVVERVIAEWGRIDAVANIAGNAPLLPIAEVTPEVWRECIDGNLSSVVYMTAAVLPHMQRAKRGAICNVSSMASIDPFPGFAIYATAKVGVNMFTRCTAREMKRFGGTCAAVAPGAVETAMLRENFNERAIPASSTLDPILVAGVIRDLLTARRSFANGETIVLPND